jgi:UDP-N-acetylmuramoyl-L-alanyl-D-glutamate--2,6-diaminopimelate ligase
MQRVGDVPIIVDYAHTPDALQTALTALRPFTSGQLIVIFGCGGDRDPGKRPQMGAIAEQLADTVIVTDDNPRSEDPATIRRAVLAAAPKAREIGDRAEAIRAAIKMLRPGDLLLVAGKGHERGQIIGDKVLPFDDVAIVRAILAEAGE